MKLIQPRYTQAMPNQYLVYADSRYLRWIEELNYFQLLMYRLEPNNIIAQQIQEKKSFYIRNEATGNTVEAMPNDKIINETAYGKTYYESDYVIQYRELQSNHKVKTLNTWELVIITENKDLCIQ